MNQLALSFEPRQLARRCDPITSHMAAEMVREFAGGQCAEILELLKRRGPLSPEQIAAHMGIDAYSVRKRLADLEHAGKAKPNGMTCLTVSGRRQRIWADV